MSRNLQIILAMFSLSVASVFAESPRLHRMTDRADANGDYVSLASGFNFDGDGTGQGFTVHGYGSSERDADDDALERCRERGKGCRLLYP